MPPVCSFWASVGSKGRHKPWECGVQVVDVNRPMPVTLASRHVERVAVVARALGTTAFDYLDSDAGRSLPYIQKKPRAAFS